MAKLLGLAVLVAIATTACGNSSESSASPAPQGKPSPSSSVVAAGTATLKDLCPKVEEAMPLGARAGSKKPVSVDELGEFVKSLMQDDADGNDEADLAIDPVYASYDLIVTAAAVGKQPTTRAWIRAEDAVSRLAARCAAVGSSAFAGE